MKLALLANINVNPLAERLSRSHEVYLAPGFDTWQTELMNPASEFYQFAPQAVLLLFHGEALLGDIHDLNEGKQALDRMLSCITAAAEHLPDSVFFVANLDIEVKRLRPVVQASEERAWEWHWYSSLQQQVEAGKNLYVFDLKSMVENMGRENFYSPKMWYLGGLPFSSKAFASLAHEAELYLKAAQGKRLKALAVDLDNTLWGGVIGEDGVAGIKLSTVQEGARFVELQKRLLELKKTGAILVLTSKNNPEDALEGINGHQDMVLREGDFAALRINWQPKPDNLAEIATELNLGLDAFAFLDDNPVEREQMRVRLPEVEIIDFPRDTALLEKTLRQAYKESFLVLRLTEEDQMKTEMYHAEQTRRELKAQAVSYEDYLMDLNIEIDIHEPREEELERVAQMTQKTNQFNLTTRRYTIGDIRERSNDPNWKLFVARSRDKYGDDGVILLLMARKERLETETEEVEDEAQETFCGTTSTFRDVAYIDTLLLSCRVMGRLIEQKVCERVIEELFAWGCDEVRGEYLPTKKNGMATNYYEELGFTLLEASAQGKRYRAIPGQIRQWPKVHRSVLVNGREME